MSSADPINHQMGENLAVHRFINDYLISNKRIKPRAFNLFHRCQRMCYNNPKADELDINQCVDKCKNSKMRLNYRTR